jgi:hypothetical protein
LSVVTLLLLHFTVKVRTLEQTPGPFFRLDLNNSRVVILATQSLGEATMRIMAQNNIPRDRSRDIPITWEVRVNTITVTL